jgi:hypothetical protein
MQLKLVVFVPSEAADRVRRVLGEQQAGVLGAYRYCSFSSVGIARFIPSKTARPSIGSVDQLVSTAEERIEVVCESTDATALIKAVRAVHPYEHVEFDIYQLINESDL